MVNDAGHFITDEGKRDTVSSPMHPVFPKSLKFADWLIKTLASLTINH